MSVNQSRPIHVHISINFFYSVQWPQSGLKSGGSVYPGKKINLISFGQISEKFRFFQTISQKILFFQENFLKISIFSGNFTKNFDFPGKNWPFTATSGQIILFLCRSHHFRTYFLYIIRYNNISRPPAQNLGVATPHPTIIDTPDSVQQADMAATSCYRKLAILKKLISIVTEKLGWQRNRIFQKRGNSV